MVLEGHELPLGRGGEHREDIPGPDFRFALGRRRRALVGRGRFLQLDLGVVEHRVSSRTNRDVHHVRGAERARAIPEVVRRDLEARRAGEACRRLEAEPLQRCVDVRQRAREGQRGIRRPVARRKREPRRLCQG